MDLPRSGSEPAPDYSLSRESAREVAARTGPPRARETFLSTDHLSTEAAAAYVDGRLPHAGEIRAQSHLARCTQCRQDVDDQREARRVLRGSGPIQMPPELLQRLRSLEDGGGTVPARGEPPAPGSVGRWWRLLRRLRRPGR